MASYKLEDVKLPYLLLFFPVFVLDLIWSVIMTVLDSKKSSRTKMKEKTMQSVAVGDATATHSAPRRSPKALDGFIDIYEGGCTTIYEMIQLAIETFPNRIAQTHFIYKGLKKNKATDRFPTKQFDYNGSPHQVTYQELGTNLLYFGQGLRELGMEPQPPIPTGKTFDESKGRFVMVIFEDTCKEWTTAMQGAMSQSMVVATCYATLGQEAVISAVNETGADVLFVNWKVVQTYYTEAKRMPTLRTIIASTHELCSEGGDSIWMPPSKDNGGRVRVVTYDEVLEMGKNSTEFGPTPPKPSDVAVIMYTSGSTGKPKGVTMKQSNLVAGIAGMVTNVHLRKGQEIFLAYLPLAHILALQVEHVLLAHGSTLCYADARTIAVSMPKFKPTIFAGVPKVYEILQSSLTRKIDEGPPVLKVVFDTLLAWKMFMLSRFEMDTPISNLFFGLISKKVFGRERLEFGVTGGGPMSASLQLFCRAVFNCPIIQGYALTETCVGGCFQSTDDPRPGVVGPPVPCVEVIVQSEPDFRDTAGLPYLHTDTKGANGEDVLGRGEICLRGPSISLGYYKLSDKTKEEFDSEGFFHTGDIGQITSDGVVQIVDRKKNLVKLKGGEYVAIEAMETAFAASPYATALCVIANGDLDGPLPIVCVDTYALEKWAKEKNIQYTTVHDLAQLTEARKEVVSSFIAMGKEAGLGSLELRIKDCALITDAVWTPGHGMTASMKLDRQQIVKMHDKEIKEMYKRNGVKV